jgi:hypothetical protein
MKKRYRVPLRSSVVGITEFTCPLCGTEVEMGLPRDAVVKSVTAAERPEPDESRQKARRLRCQNGHGFFVLFEW